MSNKKLLFRFKKTPDQGADKQIIPLGAQLNLLAFPPLVQDEITLGKEKLPVQSSPSGMVVCLVPPVTFKAEELAEMEKGFIPFLRSLGHQVFFLQWASLSRSMLPNSLVNAPIEHMYQLIFSAFINEATGITDQSEAKFAIITWGKMVDFVLWQLQSNIHVPNDTLVVAVDGEYTGRVLPNEWNGLSKVCHYSVESLQNPVLSLMSQASAPALVPKTASLFEQVAGNDLTLELVPTRSASMLGNVHHLYPAWHIVGEWLKNRAPEFSNPNGR